MKKDIEKEEFTTVSLNKKTVVILQTMCAKNETYDTLIRKIALKYSKELINDKNIQIQNLSK